MAGMAVELVGIDHVAINVSDLQKSAAFYEHVFGFTILHTWTTTWMVGRGNVKLGLFYRPDAKSPPDLETVFVIKHVAFLVDGDKFAAAQDALRLSGIPFDGPEDTGIAYSVFFRDPDNIQIELTTYHAASAPS